MGTKMELEKVDPFWVQKYDHKFMAQLLAQKYD